MAKADYKNYRRKSVTLTVAIICYYSHSRQTNVPDNSGHSELRALLKSV